MIKMYLRNESEEFLLKECKSIREGVDYIERLYRYLADHYGANRLVCVFREDNKDNEAVFVIGGEDHE